jgi:DNA-binding MarR family transcriptional regulator
VKKIKLSGREMAVLRAIDFAMGNTGAEIRERTQIAVEDLLDILNGLIDVGYAETLPPRERVTEDEFATAVFEVNPSYAMELREALIRR